MAGSMVEPGPVTERSQRPVWLGQDRRGWDHVRIHVQLLKDSRVKAIELAVYVGIAAHAELASGRAYPAASTLAKYVRLSERRVREAIHSLESWRYLDITRHDGLASTYTLLPPPPLHNDPGCRAVTPEPSDAETCSTFRTSPEPRSDEREPVEREPRNDPPTAPRGGRRLIPDDFVVTAEMRAWADEKIPGFGIGHETDVFVDYWRGCGKGKADWIATWRNWMRRAASGNPLPLQCSSSALPEMALRRCDECRDSNGFVDSPDGGPRMVACPACNPDPLEALGA